MTPQHDARRAAERHRVSEGGASIGTGTRRDGGKHGFPPPQKFAAAILAADGSVLLRIVLPSLLGGYAMGRPRILGLSRISSVLFCSSAILYSGGSLAAVTISTASTQNMTCANSICAPTATDAVLNVADLEKLLASGRASIHLWRHVGAQHQ